MINGWETDAYMLVITQPAGADEDDLDLVVRYFVACGSYLRKNDSSGRSPPEHGKVILDSLSKVYTVFTAGKPEMDVLLKGQPLINASLRTVKKPCRVKLNGKSVNAAYNETQRTATFLLDKR